MAFLAKVDYCGLETEGVLQVKSCSDGASGSVSEVANGKGEIVSEFPYGEIKAPSCDYVMCKDWTLNAKLGQVVAVDGKKYALANITVNTSIGEPTVSASAVQVADDATEGGGDFVIPSVTISATHEVQNLLGAFTIGGDGCYEQSANYTFEANVVPHTKDGIPVAHGATMGKITCALTIVQVGEVAPTLTAGEGWTVTAPLAMTNGDSAEPTYTATLVYPLALVTA